MIYMVVMVSQMNIVMRHVMNLETVNTYEGTHDIHALILGVRKQASRLLQGRGVTSGGGQGDYKLLSKPSL